MSDTVGWHFSPDQSDQWDGFNDSGIEHFRGNPIGYLGRELCQNAIDVPENGIVDVKFTLKKIDTSSVPHVAELKEIVKCCLYASNEESTKARVFFENAEKELAKDKISVLEVSDFNTKGMAGPPVNGSPFYAFMKASGQSKKPTETSTGSYGIGKFAPYAVSNFRTIYVSTVYQEDDDMVQLTQGKSILMSHHIKGELKRGTGFWGVIEKCKPIVGVPEELPNWLLRAQKASEMEEKKGTSLYILGFKETNKWHEQLSVAVAENFFGAIVNKELRVEIDGKYVLDHESIFDFFENDQLRSDISQFNNEPDQFDNCKNYLAALEGSAETIVEESEMRDLGLCRVKILVGENLPKKVCILRNGMFITDRLNLLKSFNDFKEFVAVFECLSTKGNELLRAMEPPRHDGFEPDRLSTNEEQRIGARALYKVGKWVRDMLKRHAKDPVSEVTTIDELKDFFGDEGADGSGEKGDEVNPYGDVIITARPIKLKIQPSTVTGEGAEGGDEDGGEGGGGSDGAGGGDGEGGKGAGSGGSGGGSLKALTELKNIRAVLLDSHKRIISFTPTSTGKMAVRVQAAGADSDFDLELISSDLGSIDNGKILLDVVAGKRCSLTVGLNQKFSGSLKVLAYEI